MTVLKNSVLLAAVACSIWAESVKFDLTTESYSKVGKAVLRAHNKCRKDSADIPDLIWNGSLADSALNYAIGCNWEHSSSAYRSNFAGFKYVGENMASGTKRIDENSMESTAVSAVQRWCAEVKDFTYPTTCNPGKVCGHYTQIVWATTTSVGCGLVSCSLDSKFIYPGGYFLVCQYGPGGNMRGQPPFDQSLSRQLPSGSNEEKSSDTGNNRLFPTVFILSLLLLLLL